MNRKVLFVFKLLVGAYLVFVGVTLLRTFQEVRPSNQEVMCGIAAVFILVGAGYLVGVLGGAVKRSLETRSARYMQERGPVPAVRSVHDQSMFRTAPMMTPIDLEKQGFREGEGSLRERTQNRNVTVSSAATVRLQTVGPDTMVWENKNKEK